MLLNFIILLLILFFVACIGLLLIFTGLKIGSIVLKIDMSKLGLKKYFFWKIFGLLILTNIAFFYFDVVFQFNISLIFVLIILIYIFYALTKTGLIPKLKIIALVGLVLLIHQIGVYFIHGFVIEPYKVAGDSMKQSFSSGDLILANKFTSLFRKPQRGDIIIFQYPIETHIDFMMRVIGLEKDKIEQKKNKIYIDGQPLNEVYAFHIYGNNQPSKLDFGPVQIRDNNYFVMGDNRQQAHDSRIWGFVDKKLIKGKVFFRYWPLKNLGFVN